MKETTEKMQLQRKKRNSTDSERAGGRREGWMKDATDHEVEFRRNQSPNRREDEQTTCKE